MKYSLQDLSDLDVKLMLQVRGQSIEGDRSDLLKRLESVFDVSTPFTWQLRQLPRRGPTPYRSGGSLVYHGDRLYLYGGFDENFHLHNDFWTARVSGDQVFWQESNSGNINSGPQLRDHYAFVWKDAIWLYGGVRIGLQRSTSEHIYYFDIEVSRWKSMHTRPVDGDWTRLDNPSVSVTTLAVFHPEQQRLYAFGGQVQFELGHLGFRAAYLDMNNGIWYRLPYPENVIDMKAVCIWKGRLHAIDASTNVYILDEVNGVFQWYQAEGCFRQNVGMIETLRLAALLGSIWLIVWSATPRRTSLLQINMADYSIQTADIDPITSRRESVDVLSYTVMNNSVVVTGLLGSYFSAHHGLSEPATFILETCPGKVPEPVSGTLQCMTAVNAMRRDAIYADCMIRVQGGIEFSVHKFILAAQSNYFYTMFKSGMVESVNNTVVLDDLEASVMEIVLDFVYGCNVVVPSNLAVSVFKASDRLQLPDLTKLTVDILKGGIGHESLTDVLQIAGDFINEELWEACVEFANSNRHNLCQIIGSSHFLNFMRTHAELAQRFLMDILEQTVLTS